MAQNIVYIISFVNKSVSFEWIVKKLDKEKFNLTFILLNDKDSAFERFLHENKIKTYRIYYSGKRDLIKAIFKTIAILKKEKIKILHAHLFDASIVGLLAARLIGIKKRIHTRHNATIHHDYFPSAVKYDKLINYLSTDIVAISENVKHILIDMEKVNKNKITLIQHGFDLDKFKDIKIEQIEKLRSKYLPSSERSPVIGVISRFIHWKGIQYIIPAFQKLLNEYPNAYFIFANASGPYENEIKKMLNGLPSDSYKKILFEEDIFALYKLFDIFVHVPIDEKSEAFGQVYIESLASGIPSVFTMSGIAPEFIKNKENALVVPFKNSTEIYNSIIEILKNDILKTNLISKGEESVKSLFNINKMIEKLEELYEK